MGRSQRVRPARLPEKLLQIRNALSLTQEQMIKRLNYIASPLHPQNVSGFETGEREPSLLVILAYARCVNLSTDYLIDDDLDLPAELPSKRRYNRVVKPARTE
jgi:transcriptional regulator with XRE-family HTH domain